MVMRTIDMSRQMPVPEDLSSGPSSPNIRKKVKEKGVIKPKLDVYQDDQETTIGPSIGITTKGGTDISAGIEKTQYKDYDNPPTKYDFNLGKSGDKYSYGITGSKRGKQKSITIGGKIKYSSGGLARGMGVAIKGGKFQGVK